MHRIGGAFRVSFGPFFGEFLAHTTSMNNKFAQKWTQTPLRNPSTLYAIHAPRGPAGNPSRSEKCEEVRAVPPEGRRRSHSTSRTYGGTDCASFAICSRDGVFGRASRSAVLCKSLAVHFRPLDSGSIYNIPSSTSVLFRSAVLSVLRSSDEVFRDHAVRGVL